nr:hypothetical protein [Nostoc sp. ChiQUE02]
MLQENTFKELLLPIAAYYRQEVSPPILKIYFRHLSENLTEAEFREAVEKMVIQCPARMGLPSPEQIVEIIVGSRSAMAL